MENLLNEIRKCTFCEQHLELGVNPIISASRKSKIIIIGQAPGRKVHNSSIPWDDKSGDNLRNWLGVEKEIFYNPDIFALIPMSFCFPGTGKSGDLKPRSECAPLWHEKLLKEIKDDTLTLLIGKHAQQYYLKQTQKNNLTNTVKDFKKHLPKYFPLPHPSPRNNIWMAKNSWFKTDVIPELKKRLQNIL